MKKIITFLAITGLLISGIEMKAQVAISSTGATPDASAMLDIISGTKGLLIPRVTSTANVTSPATGLMVYQTGGTPGFYYYDGGSWNQMSGSSYSLPIASGSTLGGIKVGSGLSIDGAGVLSTPGGSGSVTNIATTAPITGGPISTTGTIAINQATTSIDGYLSHTDWNTFNNKYSGLPTQTGNSGKYLTTNGTTESWGTVSGSSQWITTGSDIYYNTGSVRIGSTSAPNASAILDLSASTSKGLILPVFSARPASITAGAQGMLIYSTSATSGVYINLSNTTTPSWKLLNSITANSPLSISGNNLTIDQADASSHNGYILSSDYAHFNSAYTFSNKWTSVSNNWYYYPTASDGDGFMGIGNVSPTSRLHVRNDQQNNPSVLLQNMNSTSGVPLQVQTGVLQSSGAFAAINILDGNGGSPIVGIGWDDMGAPLLSGLSDQRLKENILDTRLTINVLMKIKVRDFNWKKDANKKNISGFIAQELYEVYPAAVIKPKDETKNWMINKESLIPLMVKSIQDQQSTIESLHTQVKNQQTVIDDLLKRVEALEKK